MYASALAAVPHADGETPAEHRQREPQHLSLTGWLRQLLYGKVRLSIVQGLEVRVPYCDHHLVEYAFSVPWALKSRTPYPVHPPPAPRRRQVRHPPPGHPRRVDRRRRQVLFRGRCPRRRG
ncbi:asparagine synthase C-terminal domain-containing protein [Streptomyces sp. tea 10]|nr:asparagine synthase C-terminal domain-containing protein [Streptomyces sp. tea 10]